MYKVFFNEHQIVSPGEFQNSFKDNIDQTIEIQDIDELLSLFSRLEKSEYVVKLLIECKNGQNLQEMLAEHLRPIPAAGGLVQNPQHEILFIKRLGRWDLPKGKIEKGETAEQAAVREVEEECGISGLGICRELPATFHIYRSPFINRENNWVLKQTFWFEMEYSANEQPKPQLEEQIETVRWFQKRELSEALENTYASLKDMISLYLPEPD